jgi:hypothetical protein
MTRKFTVDASHFDPFERESIKRSIIDQGRRQQVRIHIITNADCWFAISATGEDLDVIAYEAALCCWFNDKNDGDDR